MLNGVIPGGFVKRYSLLLFSGGAKKGRAFRTLRGGAFNNESDNCRSACRNDNHPDNRNHNIGFRVVLVSRAP
ncbi:SUMF1/EgtB/PvdO family nonheme iron enzyme [Candidatus Sumerlaeota bacterium]|nr:SUMF1/EgtB/PvdO family nonheme iron enzyme [Candidatus Sumerlaeota bacterium]